MNLSKIHVGFQETTTMRGLMIQAKMAKAKLIDLNIATIQVKETIKIYGNESNRLSTDSLERSSSCLCQLASISFFLAIHRAIFTKLHKRCNVLIYQCSKLASKPRCILGHLVIVFNAIVLSYHRFPFVSLNTPLPFTGPFALLLMH